jgi:L-alanine-DL-glutamate epimerase-like enolase superfamily enzyme
MRPPAAIRRVTPLAYQVPTDSLESDGTLEWHATTIVVVEAEAGGEIGIGYSYADEAAARFIQTVLAPAALGIDALDITRAWTAMSRALPNNGRPGIASAALSAVDASLWDLKGRLLALPVVDLIGAARDEVPVYGSDGFTSYSTSQLEAQLGNWGAEGITRVKIKVGRDVRADVERVAVARRAIGPDTELFVDVNGAYTRKEALAQAERFAGEDVSWFEEPVSSDDLEGLAVIVERAPAGMAIAAGEYGYHPFYFRHMLEARAVDVLQADATRCGGITAFLRVAALAEAHAIPLSAHTAPSLHLHVCAGLANV